MGLWRIRTGIENALWEISLIPTGLEIRKNAREYDKKVKNKEAEERKKKEAEERRKGESERLKKEAEKLRKEAEERKKKEEEEQREKEKRRRKAISLLGETITTEPIASIEWKAVRKINIFETYTIVGFTQKNIYLSLLEFIDKNGNVYIVSDDKSKASRLNEWFKMPKIYYTPDTVNQILESMEIILPRFADVEYTINPNKKKDLSADYKVKRSGTGLILEKEMKSLELDVLNELTEICQFWIRKNSAHIFGREVYDFWKKKMRILGEFADREKYSKEQSIKKAEEVKEVQEISQYGKEGELKVDYALKWLSSSYQVLEKESQGKNGTMCIIIENKEFIEEPQEIDHVVVGKQGVFLIETKYYSGHIEIDKSGNWKRIKNGNVKAEINPLQQIRRHEKIVKSFMPDNVNVISILCLAHEGVLIDGIDNFPIPIVRSDMLIEFIENYTVENNMSDADVSKVIEILQKYMKR